MFELTAQATAKLLGIGVWWGVGVGGRGFSYLTKLGRREDNSNLKHNMLRG